MAFDHEHYPSVARLSETLLAVWREHETYVAKSFEGRDQSVMAVSEKLAAAVLQLAEHVEGALNRLCEDYRFLCEDIILPEELFFRRNGRYRLSSFAEANEACYANSEFMDRYMNGLLLSNVIWNNHAQSVATFVNRYLPQLPEGTDHLEIGPGHGFFLHMAAAEPNIRSLEAWDVSPSSIENTRHSLEVLGVERPVTLKVQDLFAAGDPPEDQKFSSIIMSEVLEHVEDPGAALNAACAWLRPGGLVWINVPANSPAPDHIYLFNSLDDARDLVSGAGLEILSAEAFPISGVTLGKAIKRKQTVSCVITARKPSNN